MKYRPWICIRLTGLGFAFAAALCLAGCHSAVAPAGGPPGGGQPPMEVGVITLTSGRVTLSTDLPGRTSSYRVAEVRPQVNGVVLKRLFIEGAEVKEGQQLYQIDAAPYQAALDSALAAQQHAEAALNIAKLQANRYQTLKSTNAVSKSDFDNTMATEQGAQADVASAKAAVEAAQVNLTYTKVLAPITGRTGRSVTEGRSGHHESGRVARDHPAVGPDLCGHPAIDRPDRPLEARDRLRPD